MTDHETDRRLTRVEAKQQALETYLPALLESVRANQQEAREDFRRLESRVEMALRFTRAERVALIVALSAITATLFAALIGLFAALPFAP